MNTIQQYDDTILTGENLIAAIDAKPESNFFDVAKKYVEFGVKVILVLGKYFFKNGKLSAPSLLMFWKYFGLVTELYILFKDFEAETKK